MMLSREAAEVLEEHGADGSEAPSACVQRAREVVRALRVAGATEDEHNLSASIELYTKDMLQLWQQEAAKTGSTEGVRAWASQVLAAQDFSSSSHLRRLACRQGFLVVKPLA